MRRVLLTAVLLAFPLPTHACSGGGHIFVALASIGKLRQESDPDAQRLAQVLHKYRWIVCQGAEGPDVVQAIREYRFSHWFPLFEVDYEHPERFDLAAAQPYFTALLRDAYAVDYSVAAEEVAAHDIQLYRPPDPELREVSVAFAAGYISHLLSDYFCHQPAKVWWDKRPGMADACEKGTGVRSYGQLQIVFADMLWQRYLDEYGVEEDAAQQFRRSADDYHEDNGVLPYCALACSADAYADWPAAVRDLVDPSKFDGCAAPFALGEGHLSGIVEGDHRSSHAILEAARLELDEAIELSDELTGWREVYRRVVDMIVQAWGDAAPHLDLQPIDDTDLLARREQPGHLRRLIVVGGEPGTRVPLALHGDSLLKTWHARDGSQGTFRRWSEDPRARFDFGMTTVGEESKIAILTHPPYYGAVGFVSGEYRLQLPDTDQPIRLRGFTSLFANNADSDGVVMKVTVATEDGEERELLSRMVVGQGWEPFEVDLSAFVGKAIRLRLITDAGPKDNTVRDNAAWGAPAISVGG